MLRLATALAILLSLVLVLTPSVVSAGSRSGKPARGFEVRFDGDGVSPSITVRPERNTSRLRLSCRRPRVDATETIVRNRVEALFPLERLVRGVGMVGVQDIDGGDGARFIWLRLSRVLGTSLNTGRQFSVAMRGTGARLRPFIIETHLGYHTEPPAEQLAKIVNTATVVSQEGQDLLVSGLSGHAGMTRHRLRGGDVEFQHPDGPVIFYDASDGVVTFWDPLSVDTWRTVKYPEFSLKVTARE